MLDEDFDTALLTAGFAAIARDGWSRFSIAAATRDAGLDLAQARARTPTPWAFLRRFGEAADRAALMEELTAATVQERLFDLLMRRLDVLQTHRAGVLALLRALPADPLTAAMLAIETLNSMRWLLEAAGLEAHSPFGIVRAKGLMGVWLWTLRAWERDETDDLSATMAAVDAALTRAGQIARALPADRAAPVVETAPVPAGGTQASPP